MDRPNRGPVDPNDREPAPGEPGGAGQDDAWAKALRALRDAARRSEQDDAAGRQVALPADIPSEPHGLAGDVPRPEPAPRGDAAREIVAREFSPPEFLPRREGASGVVQVPTPGRPWAAAPAPALDETLEALQALARRYAAPAATAPGAPPWPPMEPDAGADEVSPPEPFEEPAAGARLLTRRARWTSLALILVSAAVLAVVLVGALSLSRQLFQARHDTRAVRGPEAGLDLAPADAPASPASAPAPSTAATVAWQSSTGTADLPAIEKAMNDCDDEAAKNRDALYFLVVPAVSPIKDYSHWAPLSVGDIGTSVILLRSKDALDGLREGSLAVYSGQYKFSIIDSTTDVAHDWGPITGVAKLVKPAAAAISGFRVRFSFADFVGDTPSNFQFPREKGVCYWVSALLRT